MRLFLLLLFIVSSSCFANEDSAIYANGDGTYTYFGQIYSFEEFPMEKVVIVENKVQIYPAENLSTQESLTSVKPLARKFIRAGYEVETRLFDKVIPYIVKRKD